MQGDPDGDIFALPVDVDGQDQKEGDRRDYRLPRVRQRLT